MKLIQWYPGHMAKAMREMTEQLSLVDAVILVLDARAPAASFNKKLKELVGIKPLLYVLNKADLADEGATAFVRAIRADGGKAVAISANGQSSARALATAMNEVCAEKRKRNEEKGVTKPIRFLIAGVPNTGKSTLINLLGGAKKAVTGDKAGVTRSRQWVRCGTFELMDTPGTMPPSFENQELARRLAYIGSINDDILEMDEVALALLEELNKKYPACLAERYGIDGEMTPLEMLEQVCRRRGMVLRGGEFDYERGERALIDDFRKGRLTKVCLDSIEDGYVSGIISEKENG